MVSEDRAWLKPAGIQIAKLSNICDSEYFAIWISAPFSQRKFIETKRFYGIIGWQFRTKDCCSYDANLLVSIDPLYLAVSLCVIVEYFD